VNLLRRHLSLPSATSAIESTKADSPQKSAQSSLIVRWTRWLLWLGICYSSVSLILGVIRLFAPGTEASRTKPVASTEMPSLPTAVDLSIAEGVWYVTGSDWGVSLSTVSTRDLLKEMHATPELTGMASKGSGASPTELETRILALIPQLSANWSDVGPYRVFSGERSGVKYRLVADGPTHRNLRSAHLAWKLASDKWALAHFMPHDERIPQHGLLISSVRSISDPIATRISATGEVTGEVYEYSESLSEFCSQCEAVGIQLFIETVNAHCLVATIESGRNGELRSVVGTRISDPGFIVILSRTRTDSSRNSHQRSYK